MKKTKKGFTLIELIVVIAIIGVLAAILVPAMLGYVKKSKISAAESACSSIAKGFDTAITDMVAAGYLTPADGWILINQSGSGFTANLGQLDMKTADFYASVKEYFKDLDDVASGAAYIYKGTCVGVCATVDNAYWGTFPTGYITSKNHDDYDALADAQGLLTNKVDEIT
jgi:hypothetical protein rflaF_04547